VYGDALCSFDPVYGQGMTVACAESLALRDCLAAGTRGIARRFFKAACRLIDSPWQIAVGSDLQHPRVEGKRTAQVRFINWYIAKLFQAAHRDAALATKFLGVERKSGSCRSSDEVRAANLVGTETVARSVHARNAR
jgi:hypothetical protein